VGEGDGFGAEESGRVVGLDDVAPVGVPDDVGFSLELHPVTSTPHVAAATRRRETFIRVGCVGIPSVLQQPALCEGRIEST